MVKAVIGEETRLKSAEDHLSQSAVPSQVGLVIGKITSSLDRCLVFDLVPTPPNDAGEPACSLIEADKKKDQKENLSQILLLLSSSTRIGWPNTLARSPECYWVA